MSNKPGMGVGCVWCASKNAPVVLCYPCEQIALELVVHHKELVACAHCGFIEEPDRPCLRCVEHEGLTNFDRVHPFAKLPKPEFPNVCWRCGALGDIRLCDICASSLYPRVPTGTS